jgi:hypothetical protein
MEDSEDRIVHRTDLRAREGAIFVYQELPKWLFVAQLETLEVNEWGVKGTVLPLPHVGLSCPPQAFTASGTWSVLTVTERRWSAMYAGWSMRFGEGIVAKLISRAGELAHIPLLERIPLLLGSIFDCR